MNIFATHEWPTECAQDHCDKHVVKMPLETAQLLSCAVLMHAPETSGLYAKTHTAHPCSLWARQTQDNFLWLASLGVALCQEYSFRYGRQHKSESVIRRCQSFWACLPEGPITPFAQAMPEQFKGPDAPSAYRAYIAGAKVGGMLVAFTRRPPPTWLLRQEDIEAHPCDIRTILTRRSL